MAQSVMTSTIEQEVLPASVLQVAEGMAEAFGKSGVLKQSDAVKGIRERSGAKFLYRNGTGGDLHQAIGSP